MADSQDHSHTSAWSEEGMDNKRIIKLFFRKHLANSDIVKRPFNELQRTKIYRGKQHKSKKPFSDEPCHLFVYLCCRELFVLLIISPWPVKYFLVRQFPHRFEVNSDFIKYVFLRIKTIYSFAIFKKIGTAHHKDTDIRDYCGYI